MNGSSRASRRPSRATIAVREHVRAKAEDEDRDVEAIELTAEYFERALEEISPVGVDEFAGSPSASEFEDVLEGTEAKAE